MIYSIYMKTSDSEPCGVGTKSTIVRIRSLLLCTISNSYLLIAAVYYVMMLLNRIRFSKHCKILNNDFTIGLVYRVE